MFRTLLLAALLGVSGCWLSGKEIGQKIRAYEESVDTADTGT